MVSCRPESAKGWFSWQRFVGNSCAGFTFFVMHTWCPPVLMEYGSRAPERGAIRFWRPTFLTSQHFCAGNWGTRMWAQGSGWDLEGPKNPDGLNPSIYVFVYMYKVHMCMYMLGGRMRSWTHCFFLETFLSKLFSVTILQERDFKSVSVEKRLVKMFSVKCSNLEIKWIHSTDTK